MKGKVLHAMIEYFGPNREKINHALKVHGLAQTIAISEGLSREKVDVLACAAALHDIGIPESIRLYGSDTVLYQQSLGAKIAFEILTSLSIPRDLVDKVVYLVANHHSFRSDGGLALQILFEADSLVNLDEGYLRDVRPVDIRDRYFKTKTGLELISTMFCIQPPMPRPMFWA